MISFAAMSRTLSGGKVAQFISGLIHRLIIDDLQTGQENKTLSTLVDFHIKNQ